MNLIGCYIPVDPKLTKFLPAVKASLKENCNQVIAVKHDFGKQPEHEIRNKGIKEFELFDYVWTIDGDEIILPEDQSKVINFLNKHKKYDSVMLPVINYSDMTLTKIYPMTNHRVFVLVRPKTFKFYKTRCAIANTYIFDDIFIHHFGYADIGNNISYKIQHYKDIGYENDAENLEKMIKQIPIDIPVNKNLKIMLAKYF
jgi:hypothetical protein